LEGQVGLTNDAKDVVGFLKGVNLIIVLWNSNDLSFPLDSDFKRVLTTCRNNLEGLIAVVCRICQMQVEAKELSTAIEDLVPDVGRIYYTEESLTSLLQLYSVQNALHSYSFDRPLDLRRQTKSILLSLFSRLVKAMLWVRVAYFDMNPGLSLPDLCADLKMASSILTGLCPTDVEMPQSDDLLAGAIKYWRASPDVRQGLEFTKNKPDNGLYRIVDELRGCN
jgi:hypothetical protein